MLQPFKGCEWTASLATVSNPDKHRELVGTAGVQEGNAQIAIGPYDVIAQILGEPRPVRGDPAGRYFNAEHVPTSFEVSFKDNSALLPLLSDLVAHITDVLDEFKDEFIELNV